MTPGDPTPVPRRSLPAWDDALRVATGGAVGAGTRWAVIAGSSSTSVFPWPTLLVNLAGCLLVGLLVRSPRSAAMLVGVGFAGGLTTFSTFAVEVATLLDEADLAVAAAYGVASVLGGVAAVLLGRRMAPR